jgi:hypothetical protein
MAGPSRDDLNPVPGNDDTSNDDAPNDDEAPRQKPTRRKPSIDEVFGEVLPESTSDDRDPVRRRESDADEKAREADLLRDVPPHHG